MFDAPETRRYSRCENCLYWSELIAQSVQGTIHALCLNPDAAKKDEYTAPTYICPHYVRTENGSIDDPARRG